MESIITKCEIDSCEQAKMNLEIKVNHIDKKWKKKRKDRRSKE